MASPLLGSLAATIHKAMAPIFLDATLTRDEPGTITDPADPPPPTQTIYICKAIEDQWSTGQMAGGLVASSDIKVLILANSLLVEPKPLDRVTIRGKTVQVVPEGTAGMNAVQTDPARATWTLRCRA